MWLMDSYGDEMYNTDCLYRIMLDDEESVMKNVDAEDYRCDLVLCFNGALFHNHSGEEVATHTVLETYPRVDFARYALNKIYDAMANGLTVFKVPHPLEVAKVLKNKK